MKSIKKIFLLIGISSCLTLFLGCGNDDDKVADPNSLQAFIDDSDHTTISRTLYACAAGNTTEFLGYVDLPVSIFFYPFPGASDYNYFESTSTAIDTADFKQYQKKSLQGLPVFKGKLQRFLSPSYDEERFGVITYRVGTVLHISEPIQLRPKASPTADIDEDIAVNVSGTYPNFDWSEINVPANTIYFSVITDSDNNFVSGVYTTDDYWQFYDEYNIVLDVNENTIPVLNPNTSYKFVHMGVDDENWVHSYGERVFTTGN